MASSRATIRTVHVTVTNPLPTALAHYQAELLDCMDVDRECVIGDPARENIEGLGGFARVRRGAQLVGSRLRVRPESDVHLVLWPAFGYLDAVTWSSLARRQHVAMVIHDIEPLRQQFGHSRAARTMFAHAVGSGSFSVICHTHHAAGQLAELTGVTAHVLAHPMLTPKPALEQVSGPPVIRVLGQYKTARDLDVLEEIAAAPEGRRMRLEVWGRGWPQVPGWRTFPGFLSEHEFSAAVRTSRAIVLPYGSYYQSGVMVRAAENGVPVVGIDHPQIRGLYGHDWTGIAADGEPWHEALWRSISADDVIDRVTAAHDWIRVQWNRYTDTGLTL